MMRLPSTYPLTALTTPPSALPIAPQRPVDWSSRLQAHLSSSGTPARAVSICRPQPAQVGLPQVSQVTLQHLFTIQREEWFSSVACLQRALAEHTGRARLT